MNCEMNLRISTSISVEKRWYELEDGFRKLEQIPPTASRGQTCHRGQSASPDVAGKLEEERNATPLRRWGRMKETTNSVVQFSLSRAARRDILR
jgi:hypothetical protein